MWVKSQWARGGGVGGRTASDNVAATGALPTATGSILVHAPARRIVK